SGLSVRTCTSKQAGSLNVVLVANSKIKLELGCLKLKITLRLTIRHQHQCGGEPSDHKSSNELLRAPWSYLDGFCFWRNSDSHSSGTPETLMVPVSGSSRSQSTRMVMTTKNPTPNWISLDTSTLSMCNKWKERTASSEMSK